MLDNLLVFGNRNRAGDYLFESELSEYQKSGALSIRLAFSRDGPVNEKKTYVQDVMSQNPQMIYEYLVQRRGILFISGSAGNMPKGVKEAIVEIIRTQTRITQEQAQEAQAEMVKQGRWKQETW